MYVCMSVCVCLRDKTLVCLVPQAVMRCILAYFLDKTSGRPPTVVLVKATHTYTGAHTRAHTDHFFPVPHPTQLLYVVAILLGLPLLQISSRTSNVPYTLLSN